MRTRTLSAFVAAALLVPFGAVAADGSTSDTSYDPTFKIKIAPHEQWAPLGAAATYRIVAEGRSETVVHLALRAPDGVVATLSADELPLAPGQPGSAVLTVEARATTNATPLVVFVVATSGEETHEAKAVLYAREKQDPARPCPARANATAADACDHRKPDPARSGQKHSHGRSVDPEELERRVASMLARLERALAKLEMRDHERPDAKPMPRPDPRPEPRPLPPALDVTLRLSDENVTLGSEGRRVALLIENGGREGRLALELRVESDGGWKVELEKDVVILHPHERTYVWIGFAPGTTGSVAYAIRGGDAGVHGKAHFPEASIA